MNKGKILVVDDEPDIIKTISGRLLAHGFEVLAALDGLQAIHLAFTELPDAIILDIGLPSGDGHLVARRLRESTNTAAIPIIFLTARTSESDFRKALDRDIDKYLTKPFRPEDLLAALDELVMLRR